MATPTAYESKGFFYFMENILLNSLHDDAKRIQKITKLPLDECFKLAVEIWKAESFEKIAYFLRRDGEFQESIHYLSQSIKHPFI